MNRRVISALSTLALVLGVIMMGAVPAQAATCYGYGCTGLNPNNTSCVNDARTIAAMDVKGEGMLELRWSPSCNASWGRFTTYWYTSLMGAVTGTGVTYGRVTAWNPGQPSQGVIGGSGVALEQSWWSGMVTGTTTSCTGVEIFVQGEGSLGWTWGPCVA